MYTVYTRRSVEKVETLSEAMLIAINDGDDNIIIENEWGEEVKYYTPSEDN